MAGGTRERIVAAAGELFAREGIRATGVNAIIAASGVAKATFYRHFASKDELVAAWLATTVEPRADDVLAKMAALASTPVDRIDVLFDTVTERLGTPDFAGFPFISVATEIATASPAARDLVLTQLAEARALLRELCAAAGTRDPDGTAAEIQLLLLGLLIRVRAEPEARVEAGRTAREAARRLVETTVEATDPLPGAGPVPDLTP